MHGPEKITSNSYPVPETGRSYNLLTTFTLRMLMDYIPIFPTP